MSELMYKNALNQYTNNLKGFVKWYSHFRMYAFPNMDMGTVIGLRAYFDTGSFFFFSPYFLERNNMINSVLIFLCIEIVPNRHLKLLLSNAQKV